MSNQADHTIVRLRVPPDLKEKIEKSAEENNRSQSAEMVDRLEKSFSNPLAKEDPKKMLERLDTVIGIMEAQDQTIKAQSETILILKSMLDDLQSSTTQAVELLKKKTP
ncbi:hypothetical protein F993_01524 [Acinetobacter proteolyticus]|uniref:Arc-like DNA binding domain-containing protein n=1 Tax=Acinetobacter proteolyticus TaxID=1776741 RepID=A0ABP2TQB7_9GAMM|nr:Arc family DNA-binding protein [Acinetobacter proteolyticus]ENU24208.1 hypothetical protein F993_01524 [Acinetobacter proteolyticus]